MRMSEQVTIEVKSDVNADFGKATPQPPWEKLCKAYAEISGTIVDSRRRSVVKTGRLVRSSNQMESVFDEDITIRYHEPTHRAWQQERTLRIVDALDDVYGVKSVKVLKGRVWWLKMGVVRG